MGEGERRIGASERWWRGCYHRYVSTKYRDIVAAVRCKNILSGSRRHGAQVGRGWFSGGA